MFKKHVGEQPAPQKVCSTRIKGNSPAPVCDIGAHADPGLYGPCSLCDCKMYIGTGSNMCYNCWHSYDNHG